MRIIKHSETAIDEMAKYMIEMMGQTSYYHASSSNIKASACIEIDGQKFYMRSVIGVIFTPLSVNTQHIETRLIEKIEKLEKKLPQNYMNFPRVVKSDVMSTVKVNPGLGGVHSSANGCKFSRIKFHQSRSSYDSATSTFSWIIRPIKTFDFDINDYEISSIIASHIVSIFYDKDDICHLNNDEFVVEFKKEHLRLYPKLLDVTVHACKNYMPFAYEINKFWSDRLEKSRRPKFHHIDETALFSATLEELSELGTIDKVCYNCDMPLYDDNYVLVNSMRGGTFQEIRSYCPICLHSSSKKVEVNLPYIFRVTFPLKLQDVDLSWIGEPKRSVIIEGIKCGIDIYTDHVTIGEHYVGVPDTLEYLFGDMKCDKERLAIKWVS